MSHATAVFYLKKGTYNILFIKNLVISKQLKELAFWKNIYPVEYAKISDMLKKEIIFLSILEFQMKKKLTFVYLFIEKYLLIELLYN